MLSSSNTRRRLHGTENGFCTLLSHLTNKKKRVKIPPKLSFWGHKNQSPRTPPRRRIAPPPSEILNTPLRLSVRHAPVLRVNGYTYPQSFFRRRRRQDFSLGGRIEAPREWSAGRGVPLPAGGGVWGGGCAPSTDNF